MIDPSIMLVGVGLLSITCQLLAHRFKVPAILPLLITGIALGPIWGVINPDQLFGDLLFPLVSLAVAVILFEGALTLNIKDLGGHGTMVRNLCTVGAAITWFVATPVAHFALGISWPTAFLFGAIVTVTGPTVIVPMLRTVRPNARIANILRWEGIVIDPIGALLAVLVYEYIAATQNAWIHTIWAFTQTLAVGIVLGIVSGFLLAFVLRKNYIPHYLINTAVLTIMLGAYAGSNQLAHESGLLTVTIMGIWMANTKGLDLDSILEFKETLSVLLISALFILLAARLDLDELLHVGWGAPIVLAVIIFIARPISVVVSSWGTDLNWRELGLLSWISPRGIVAAAVSSLFAIKLEKSGFEEAGILVPMVFLVIISTVVLQSLTAKWVAQWLKVRAPAPRGFIIFGASRFSRQLAKEMINKGVHVIVADTNWDAIREARMANIPNYYGNPASEHAQRTMDLTPIGKVLVISPYKQLNPVITYHFQYQLGKGAVMGLPNSEQQNRASHQISEDYAKKLVLFGNNITYSQLASLTSKGATVKTTRLTAEFGLDAYFETFTSNTIPLVAIEPNGKCHIYTDSPSFKPGPDWHIISLIPADVMKELNQDRALSKHEKENPSADDKKNVPITNPDMTPPEASL